MVRIGKIHGFWPQNSPHPLPDELSPTRITLRDRPKRRATCRLRTWVGWMNRAVQNHCINEFCEEGESLKTRCRFTLNSPSPRRKKGLRHWKHYSTHNTRYCRQLGRGQGVEPRRRRRRPRRWTNWSNHFWGGEEEPKIESKIGVRKHSKLTPAWHFF